MGYTTKVYRADGGDKQVVASGGVLDIENGGELQLAGTQVTATAAELNKLAGAGAVVASGTQAAFQADLATDADGTAIAGAVNGLRDALIAFGVMASE